MKLLGSTEEKTIKGNNGENVPQLKITYLVLVHCNILNNQYQQESRILSAFSQCKSFGQQLNISPTYIYTETFHLEFLCIEVWFTN